MGLLLAIVLSGIIFDFESLSRPAEERL